jgi:pilus assembly protein CpaF
MQPILDARLEDGSRVAAMFPPCSVDGPTLTVRKFTKRYALDDLVAVGTLTEDVAQCLRHAVADRQNILISGGTGTGKTTVLNALAETIPPEDRIVLIEETSEIRIDKPNLVRFEARRAQSPLGQEAPLPAVSIADLVRATLRHRPDRIIVGEVRGAEAFDLLQALNTGHLGSLTTIHANAAEQALTRLAHCVLTANVGLPHRSIREAIALAVQPGRASGAGWGAAGGDGGGGSPGLRPARGSVRGRGGVLEIPRLTQLRPGARKSPLGES